MASKGYRSDLSDAEWSLLRPHLPAPKKRGRPRIHSPREVCNAHAAMARLMARRLARAGKPHHRNGGGARAARP